MHMKSAIHSLLFRPQVIIFNRNLQRKYNILSELYNNHNKSGYVNVISRKKSYCQYKYSSELENLVNLQIQAEQQAAQEYLSMAVSFLHPGLSRPGAGGFFMKMYDEEISHMRDFIHYQLLRGGTPVLHGIKPPSSNASLTLLNAFKQGLDLEKNIAELLEKIVTVAESTKDYQCADFVTSVFLVDQMKSVNEMAHHVTRLARFCDNEHAMYHYDLQLANLYPYTYKLKSPV